MFAIVKIAGLQHTVKKGDVIKVNRLKEPENTEITIDHVLAKGEENNLSFGNPVLENTKVIAKVLENTKDAKVIIFKKKRRHNYRRKRGFRQSITKLEILDIK